jgi:hypothetical protein
VGHSLRFGLSAETAELRRFLAILRGIQPGFSATQTEWRRGVDSNPRYRSEWRKRRRVRKLQGINLLSGDRGWVVLRHYGKPVRFPVESEGEWVAILRWKVVSTSALRRPNWFARDCVTAAQSQSEKYLRRLCWSKGEWLAILQNSCPCFVTQLPLLVGKHEFPIRLIVFRVTHHLLKSSTSATFHKPAC